MSTGRLIINGKTWGEFESAKRIKDHIVISGYESYGGCHTVRGIKQPELNENQQTVLDVKGHDKMQETGHRKCRLNKKSDILFHETIQGE